MKKIAAFAHRLDPLFMSQSSTRDDFFLLVPRHHLWLRSVVRGPKILLFDTNRALQLDAVSDEDIIRHSNVTDLMHKKRINAFLTSHRGSLPLKRWATDEKFELLGTNVDHQIMFENKLNFDRLLKRLSLPSPESCLIKGPSKPSSKPFPYPFVVQEPSSFGSFGTFIVKNESDWKALTNRLSPHRLYLARRFIKGRSFGITMYIDEFRIALSAIRQQCFYEEPLLFAGIQWKKTSFFKKKTIRQLNQCLLHLGFSLQDQGFFGFANVDFIVTPEGEISLLECNPRLSSASPHLFSVPELFHKLPIAELYLNRGDVEDVPAFFFYHIPESDYEGALLDVTCLVDSYNCPPCESGAYKLKGSVKLVNSDPPDLSARSKMLFYYAHENPTQMLHRGEEVGSLFSTFPLFSKEGKLNTQGEWLYKRFLTPVPLSQGC